MYNSLGEGARVTIKTLIWILREYINALSDTPQSFLLHVANEKIEKLSTKASILLMTRYKDLGYFESDDVEPAALINRILTDEKVVEVDVSPSEDFVICGYEEKGIELFSLSNMKPIWKIDDIVAKRIVFSGIRSYEIVSRCIVFHPFLNIIFPGQLHPVLNLDGKYQSGPITCENVPTRFKFCCFSHDHNKMVTNHDNHLIVWDLRYKEKVRTLECDVLVMSILFSGNDRYIATATYSSFQVYDTEQWYRLVSWRCDSNDVVFSTFKLDSWYCWRADKDSGSVVRYDQTSNKPVNIDFFLWPRNARAMIEFQAIMENETRMWFHKLGSRGDFFTLENGRVLFFKYGDRQLKIFKVIELRMGSKLKQEYDKCRVTGSLFVQTKSAIISVDGRYIYTSSPYIDSSNTMLSSIQPGKSWKLLCVHYTYLIPVKNGVLLMNVKKDDHLGTPELWNANLTERLFNFLELAGTCRCISVTENLVACIMSSQVRFLDVAKKDIVACTYLPGCNSRDLSSNHHTDTVIACGSQYHVLYTKGKNTLLLLKANSLNLSVRVLNNLKPSEKYIGTACFSLSGNLLAFLFGDLIHIFDLLTYKIRCNIPLHNKKASRLEFFNEEHLLCQGDFDLFVINVKTGGILTSINLGVEFEWSFSACRKTGDIVVFNYYYKKLKLLKLSLSRQRTDGNDLRSSCSLINA